MPRYSSGGGGAANSLLLGQQLAAPLVEGWARRKGREQELEDKEKARQERLADLEMARNERRAEFAMEQDARALTRKEEFNQRVQMASIEHGYDVSKAMKVFENQREIEKMQQVYTTSRDEKQRQTALENSIRLASHNAQLAKELQADKLAASNRKALGEQMVDIETMVGGEADPLTGKMTGGTKVKSTVPLKSLHGTAFGENLASKMGMNQPPSTVTRGNVLAGVSPLTTAGEGGLPDYLRAPELPGATEQPAWASTASTLEDTTAAMTPPTAPAPSAGAETETSGNAPAEGGVYLTPGNGRKLEKVVGENYFALAKGDKRRAREMALADGWVE